MPKGYRHLTYEQRCQIFALLKRDFSENQIANDLSVSQSTVHREVKRNTGKRGYRYKQAQNKATDRKQKASFTAHKMTPSAIVSITKMLTEQQWSPEQISGRMKIEMGVMISHETIYKYIWKDKHDGGRLYKNLRRSGKKYNRRRNKTAGRGLIPGRVGIEKRPKIVEEKIRVGDFEMDTIIGARHRGAIVSLVDRRTKITRLGLISRATAAQTNDTIIKLLSPIKKCVLTMTADNGKEFSKHADLAKALQANVYFANPYHSWERGLNENTNGLVRQYFPKKCDFTKLTTEQVIKVEILLNTRPRKTLKYQTPNEVFLQLTGIRLDNALQN